MNWDRLLPWRSELSNDTKDSKQATQVVEGNGPERVIVNESEQDKGEPYGVVD